MEIVKSLGHFSLLFHSPKHEKKFLHWLKIQDLSVIEYVFIIFFQVWKMYLVGVICLFIKEG